MIMNNLAKKIARRFIAKALATKAQLMAIRPDLAKAAQKVYDEWDDARAEELGGGGICQDIADAVSGVLDHHGIESGVVSAAVGDQHVYAIAQVQEGVFEVDIAPHTYEQGGGYNWKKIPGVKFDSNDISISLIEKDPDKFDEIMEEP